MAVISGKMVKLDGVSTGWKKGSSVRRGFSRDIGTIIIMPSLGGRGMQCLQFLEIGRGSPPRVITLARMNMLM